MLKFFVELVEFLNKDVVRGNAIFVKRKNGLIRKSQYKISLIDQPQNLCITIF